MEITEVRIKLMEDPGERLQAFCSITFDNAFVIRDLKVIDGSNGPFVAMPSRKLTAHCHQCGTKNHLRAVYCNQCGGRLKQDHSARDDEGRAKLYADIAHPINSACRELIQERVIAAYHEEVDRSKLPGYVSNYADYEEELAAAHVSGAAPGEAVAVRNVPRAPAPRREAAPREAAPRPATDPAPVKPAAMQPAQVQPPEQPRGPHKAPARAPAPAAPHSRGDETFGEGIF